MNRSGLLLICSLIFIIVVWLLAFYPSSQDEFVASELFDQNSSSGNYDKDVKAVETKSEATELVSEPAQKKPIYAPKVQRVELDNYGLFQKKHEKEVFIKAYADVALTGGDQIVGFLKDSNSLEPTSFYKSEVKKSTLWPGGVVPYGFSKNFPEELKDKVLYATEYFNYETNIRFVEFNKEQDDDAVVFTFNEDVPCSSYVGRIGGLQQIFLNFNCSEQSVLHELMHTLGFVHEQQLPSRDSFVDILWENIEKTALHNFAQAPEVWTKIYLDFDTVFDYQSIMMYGDQAFAKKGLKSMRSTTDQEVRPVARGLSESDLERLRILY